MIHRIRLHPYKVHNDIELTDLPPVSVIVGRNNAGKSSILYSLTLPKYGLSWVPWLPNAPTGDPAVSGNPRAEVEIDYGGSTGVVVIKLEQVERDISQTVESGSAVTVDRIKIPDPGDASGPSGPMLGAPAESKSTYFLGAYRAVPGRAFDYIDLPADVGYDGGNCWNILHQLKANDRPEFQEVVNTISELGFGVDSIRTPTASPGKGTLRLGNFGRADELPFLGSGVAALLPIVTQGALCKAGDSLLIEEPELHLHTGSLAALWTYFGRLKEKGVQLIVTTQSTDFVESLVQQVDRRTVPDTSMVYVVDRDTHGQTAIQSRPVGFFQGQEEPVDAVRRVMGRRG